MPLLGRGRLDFVVQDPGRHPEFKQVGAVAMPGTRNAAPYVAAFRPSRIKSNNVCSCAVKRTTLVQIVQRQMGHSCALSSS